MEQKTCQQIGIDVCKAQCCHWVPMKEKFLIDNQKHFQRPVYGFADYGDAVGLEQPAIFNDLVYPITHTNLVIKDGIEYNEIDKSKQACPFLNPTTFRCAIYDKRPEICRAYGRCKNPLCSLACGFQFGKPYSFPPDGSKEAEFHNSEVRQILDIAYMHKYEPKLFNEMTENVDKSIIEKLVDTFDSSLI